MCDYSLHHYPNRLAEEGEALVVHRFPSVPSVFRRGRGCCCKTFRSACGWN
jgi:hypothetical protein